MTGGLEARLFDIAERQTALDLLSRDSVANLHLIDLASRMGGLSDPGEMPREIAGVWRTDELIDMSPDRMHFLILDFSELLVVDAETLEVKSSLMHRISGP